MVANEGGTDAGPFRVGLYLSTNDIISTGDIFTGTICDYPSGLSAGTSSTCSGPMSVPGSLTPGDYYVGAIADDEDIVVESREDNNSRAAPSPTTFVPAGPDLTVTSVTAPSSGTIGGSISISLTVVNEGGTDAGPFRVGLYLSTNDIISTGDIFTGTICDYPSGLSAGTSSTCSGPMSVPGSVSPGTYYVGAIADDQDIVVEIHEDNNARAAPSPTVLN
jgi:subtilase family serine protease